jgi:predicted nucleic acid-binding protein
MSKTEILFWDTCVVTAYLTGDHPDSELANIEQYLRDCKSGLATLYLSTISIAEILPKHITNTTHKSYDELLEDLDGSMVLISPDPNVMKLASSLRNISYRKRATKTEIVERKLDVPDAIILATAITLQAGYGVNIDKLHTYDGGKKRGPEGPCIPLLGYETWCELLEPEQKALAQKVINLNRCKPLHPTPEFGGV